VDTFLTFVYITNHLPTPFLNHCSPYTANKLEYRSKPCIFLGYSYVGYRCLDPLTNKVYLSRHVVFYEHSFPAKDHAQLHLPTKINATSDSFFTVPVSNTLPQSTLISDSPASAAESVLESLESTSTSLSNSQTGDSPLPQPSDF